MAWFESRQKPYRIHGDVSNQRLIATRLIEPLERILVFTGPRITYRKVELLPNPDLALQIGRDSYILCKNDGRFVDHSCSPNCGIINDNTLVAVRPVYRGTTITMDYSTTQDRWTECDFDCECGERECRKKIAGFETLAPSLQQDYLQHGIVQDFLVQRYRRKHCNKP